MRPWKPPLLILKFIILIVISTPTLSATNNIQTLKEWKAIESEHFQIYFTKEKALQAWDTLFHLESYYNRLLNTPIYLPQKTSVVLEDYGMTVNGAAMAPPIKLKMGTHAPPSWSTLSQYKNFNRLLSIHELTHALHMSSSSYIPRFFTRIFSDFFHPNLYNNRWLIEGVAVKKESFFDPYEGRLNSPYYQAVLNAHIKDNKTIPYTKLDSPYHHHLQGSIAYIYGSLFMQYLTDTYSEDHIDQYISESSKHILAPLGILFPSIGSEYISNKVFKKPFFQLYKDFINNEQNKQSKAQALGDLHLNINGQIQFITPHLNHLYLIVNQIHVSAPFEDYPYTQIIRYTPNTKTHKVIYQTNSPIKSPPQIQNNTLYFLTEDTRLYFKNITQNSKGSVHQLNSLTLDNYQSNTLLTGPITQFIPKKNGDILYSRYSHYQQQTDFYLFSQEKSRALTSIKGHIAELRQYKDRIYCTAKFKNESWNLYQLDLETKELTPVFQRPEKLSHLHFSKNGLTFLLNTQNSRHIYEWIPKKNNATPISLNTYNHLGLVFNKQVYHVQLTGTGSSLYAHPHPKTQKNSIKHLPYKKETIPSSFQESVLLDGLKTNIKQLKSPHTKLLPSLIAGNDPLGLVNYSISLTNMFSDNKSLNASLSTRLFSPAKIASEYYKGVTTINTLFPIYLKNDFAFSLTHSIQSLAPSLIGIEGTWERPFLRSIFSIKNNIQDRSTTLINADISAITRQFKAQVTFEQRRNYNSEYQLDPETILILKSANQLDLHITRPISKKSFSLYPIIALRNQESFITLFYRNLSNSKYQQLKQVFGVELSVESILGNNITTVPGIGISFNENGPLSYFKLDIFN